MKVIYKSDSLQGVIHKTLWTEMGEGLARMNSNTLLVLLFEQLHGDGEFLECNMLTKKCAKIEKNAITGRGGGI